MLLFQTITITATITFTYAHRCYDGQYQRDNKPILTIECGGRHCTKIQPHPFDQDFYGCDLTELCRKKDDGCSEDSLGTTCCCQGELCNISTQPSCLIVLPILALYKVFM
ncbi:unnamed protein product [Cylicocyclus nassatus]|uniref:Uncharacterized protein n=1 Tax=Cylicocyclus nassatus TaxID=53992 RepID=A0AA36H681_CYLNA|nr:unnamed protein product [Cylicocyclus nassatus]